MFFPGGLPGAGAQGGPFRAAGTRVGEGLILNDSVYAGSLTGDTLRGFAGPGAPFILARRERVSPSLGLRPPGGATVLFAGPGTDEWTNAAGDEAGNLIPLQREAVTKRMFSRFSLHLEFRMPFLPEAIGPARGNSGVRFLDDEYFYAEIQLLDSFGGDPGSEECGGIEGRYAGEVMAAFPPGVWQTLDIRVSTPAEGADTAAAGAGVGTLTVWQNGILIHPPREIPVMGKRVRVALQSLDSGGAFRNVWAMEGDDRYPFPTVAIPGSKPGGRKRLSGEGDARMRAWKAGAYRIDGTRIPPGGPRPQRRDIQGLPSR